MTRDIEVPDALMERIAARFDARGVLEVVATVAAYNMVSRLLVALRIEHGGASPSRVLLIKCRRAAAADLVPLCAGFLADVRRFEALEADECYVYGALVADRAAPEQAAVKRLHCGPCARRRRQPARSDRAAAGRVGGPAGPVPLRRRDRRAARARGGFQSLVRRRAPARTRGGARNGRAPAAFAIRTGVPGIMPAMTSCRLPPWAVPRGPSCGPPPGANG